ncbi:hypothetical protein [Amycolatopsis sulphurea]|uniref:hypothetical protein n=1 Tax=Amycolatopsis sulphurea TaxID=76022 RepID=UPI001145416F|nr:hypothetical protein [Amycolatopsis sulphurea]
MNVDDEGDRPAPVVLAVVVFAGQSLLWLISIFEMQHLETPGRLGLLAMSLIGFYSVLRLWLGGRWGRITLTVLAVPALVFGYGAVDGLADGFTLSPGGVGAIAQAVLAIAGLVLAYLPASNAYLRSRSS